MKVSIITISLNNIVGLEKTIASIMSQTWRDFEWIIIDGGSTDGSKEVIEELAKNPLSNISYWCSERDNGVYNAMNKGIAHCVDDYICCMNSGDVFYDENTLKNVFCKEYNSDILYGDWIRVCDETEEFMRAPVELGLYELYKHNICQQAMFVKTSILKEKGFDETYSILGDYKRWVDAFLLGNSFEHTNQIVCRFDTSGMSNTHNDVVEAELIRIIESYPPLTLKLLKQIDTIKKEYIDNPYLAKTKNIFDKGGVRLAVLRLLLRMLSEKL